MEGGIVSGMEESATPVTVMLQSRAQHVFRTQARQRVGVGQLEQRGIRVLRVNCFRLPLCLINDESY